MSRPPPPPSPVFTLRGVGGAVNALQFSCLVDHAPVLFSGSGKGNVHIWNLRSRRAEKVLEGHSGQSVLWLSVLTGSGALLSQGRDQQVHLWDLSEGRGHVTDSVWTGSVGFCSCSLLEAGLARPLLAHAGEQMDEVRLVELPSKLPVCTLLPDAKHGMLMCLRLWQPDAVQRPLLLAGYEDGSLLLWDVGQRAMLSRVVAHEQPVMCLTFDPKRRKGVSGSAEKKMSTWTLDTQDNLLLGPSIPLTNPGVSQLCVREDERLLVAACWDHRLRLFGWKKLRPLAALRHHADVVLSAAFCQHHDPKHRLLAAGSKDERISLWSVYNQASDP